MSYRVKEIFRSLQGEGFHAGRATVFCRFSGCNLWSGREEDRPLARCRFCDTDFVGVGGPGGGLFATAGELADAIASRWPTNAGGGPFVVLTGGEPLLQLDQPLLEALHERGCTVAVETNGTLPAPPGVDWLTVSPKAGTVLAQQEGDELKLVYPQPGAGPELFAGLAFDHFFLQPLDGPEREADTRSAVRYCLEHPRWRLGLQIHKVLGIP